MSFHTLHSSSLHLVIGPMYCGKTTEMLRRLNIYAEMGLKVLYINTYLDDRSDQDFSTHSSYISSSGKIDTIRVKGLDNLKDQIKKYDVIGIDEAQMFKNLKNEVLYWVEEMNKTVIVSGLNGDFLRRPFGEIIDLIPYCDTIQKLNPFCFTCCKAGKYVDALFSKRESESKETILIGGKDLYIPVCRKCYLK